MRPTIKHIWFDMEGTLTVHTPEWEAAHDQLLLEKYAHATGKQPSPQLWQEYSQLYRQHGTHSAAFSSLGLASGYWQQHFATLDEQKYYKPDERVYQTLQKLRAIVPISVYTNAKPARLQNTLRVIQVDPAWFTHLLTGDDVVTRKPALDGFHKMIELSNLQPEEILYVGDRLQSDILPVKKAGMQTGFVWGTNSEADFSFECFADIPRLLR